MKFDPPHFRCQASSRRDLPVGFTLVELLIVIGIMMVLVSIAIPAIRFLTRGDSVREAAREINLFIESARSDAVSEGYGGIWIERNANSNKATRLYKVRRPQRYSGDFLDTKALIQHGPPPYPGASGPCAAAFNTTFVAVFYADENTLFEPDPDGVRGINVNDRIQFGNKGPWYIIQQICGDLQSNTIQHPLDSTRNAYVCEIALSASDFSRDTVTGFDNLNAYLKPAREAEVTYRIERTPMISTRDYLQLPRETYINLAESGFIVSDATVVDDQRGGGAEFSDPNNNKALPILIVFREDGSIDRIDYELNLSGTNITKSQFPPSSVFLHIAAESETLDPSHDPLADLDNLWIMISRSNGTVITADSLSAVGSTNRPEARANSRRAAREGQNQSEN